MAVSEKKSLEGESSQAGSVSPSLAEVRTLMGTPEGPGGVATGATPQEAKVGPQTLTGAVGGGRPEELPTGGISHKVTLLLKTQEQFLSDG